MWEDNLGSAKQDDSPPPIRRYTPAGSVMNQAARPSTAAPPPDIPQQRAGPAYAVDVANSSSNLVQLGTSAIIPWRQDGDSSWLMSPSTGRVVFAAPRGVMDPLRGGANLVEEMAGSFGSSVGDSADSLVRPIHGLLDGRTQRNRHSVDVDVLDEVVFRGVGTGSAAVCPPAEQTVNESWIQSVKSIRRAGGGNREASLVRFAPVLDASNRQRAPRREGASSIDRSIALSAVDVSSTNQPAVNPMYYDSMNEKHDP